MKKQVEGLEKEVDGLIQELTDNDFDDIVESGSLIAELENFSAEMDIGNDDDFTKFINLAFNVPSLISEKDLAREFAANLTTVERYKSGKSHPHVAIRPDMIDFILGRVKYLLV